MISYFFLLNATLYHSNFQQMFHTNQSYITHTVVSSALVWVLSFYNKDITDFFLSKIIKIRLGILSPILFSRLFLSPVMFYRSFSWPKKKF
jgi:predicted transcriptional regulator